MPISNALTSLAITDSPILARQEPHAGLAVFGATTAICLDDLVLRARARTPRRPVVATITAKPVDAWPHHLERIVKNVSFTTQNRRMAPIYFS